MAVAGHYLSAQAAFSVLEAGGNAVDAGVAGGLVDGVVQADQVNVAGVAPIMIYLAERREVLTISGLGGWPRAADCGRFEREYGGTIPEGILRTVVPAAPAAWIAALEKFGTMSFGEVAQAALRLAREGFPIHAFTAAEIRKREDHFRRWPANAAIFLPKGRPPLPGELFVQADLGRTLQYLVDEEAAAAARHGRAGGLRAVHDAFYKGDIADVIVRYHREHGGLLAAEDLAEFEVGIEPPVSTSFNGLDVYTCGFWCQGPVLLQALNLLAGYDLHALGHNSTRYIHTVAEALKLAFADRHFHYGDPRMVDVPAQRLLCKSYAEQRRRLIREQEAWPEMPPPGEVAASAAAPRAPSPSASAGPELPDPDTSYVCTVDREGNVFSVSPSDTSYDTEVIPGTGLCPSSRGSQSWADSSHPSSIAPGKRPRLTPNPALALRDGKPYLAFGTPGGDVQPQAMLQVLLNIAIFAMDPQNAVEAPRFITRSHPDSFEPHHYYPGELNLEGRIAREIGEALAAKGHGVQWWPASTSRTGGVCAVRFDQQEGSFHAGADYRRIGYALGW
jgi:gamma-glutamyltranspeptidase/glutathione hydrolase